MPRMIHLVGVGISEIIVASSIDGQRNPLELRHSRALTRRRAVLVLLEADPEVIDGDHQPQQNGRGTGIGWSPSKTRLGQEMSPSG